MRALMRMMRALKKKMKALMKKMKKAKKARKKRGRKREPMTRERWEAMARKAEEKRMKRIMKKCGKTLLKMKKCTSKKECAMTCAKNMATLKAEQKKLREARAVMWTCRRKNCQGRKMNWRKRRACRNACAAKAPKTALGEFWAKVKQLSKPVEKAEWKCIKAGRKRKCRTLRTWWQREKCSGRAKCRKAKFKALAEIRKANMLPWMAGLPRF